MCVHVIVGKKEDADKRVRWVYMCVCQFDWVPICHNVKNTKCVTLNQTTEGAVISDWSNPPCQSQTAKQGGKRKPFHHGLLYKAAKNWTHNLQVSGWTHFTTRPQSWSSEYSPQRQTAQAPTNWRTHFHTWPRHWAAPAQVGASPGSTER